MLILPLFLLGQTQVTTPVKYAMLVGIDHYRDPAGTPVGKPWRSGIANLEGCENDVEAMDDVLVRVYGLKDDGKQIFKLKSQAATRKAILDGIDALAANANSGDTVFFFYSGHGSTVKNSATQKLVDQETPPVGVSNTIVPADTMLGVPDISDKDLANHFNKIVSKGVKLTAVFDSCYSGTIARGVGPVAYKVAESPNVEIPLMDIQEPDPPYAPADKGALIISAAAYYQPAGEVRSLTPPRGAFAYGLTETLLEDKGQASFKEIFAAATARCKLEVPTQEPSYQYEGSPERLKAGLFGENVHGGLGMRLFVLHNPSSSTGQVTLQGGTESHIFKGTVLMATAPGATATAVVDGEGLGQSTATFSGGDSNLFMQAQSFTIHKQSAVQGLRLLVPRSSLSAAQLTQESAQIASEVGAARFVGDPVSGAPTAELMQSQSQWLLFKRSAAQTPVTLQGIPKALAPADKLFVSLPLAADKASDLKFGQQGDDTVTEASSLADHPDYVLTGRVQAGKLYYLWVSPTAGETQASVKAGAGYQEHTAGDSLSFMPQETTPYDADDPNLSAELQADAERLGNLKNWSATASEDQGDFPYHLEVMDNLTHQPVPNGGSVVGYATIPTSQQLKTVHSYQFLLVQDPNTTAVDPTPRFVYLMNIGPDFGGNLIGRPLSVSPRPSDAPQAISKATGFAKTLGTERFILLSSQTQLPVDLFNFKGFVTSRGGDNQTPLERLLRQNGSGKRDGGDIAVPTTWSISRCVFQSHL